VSRDIGDLRAGVVGTGFIGAVHVEALRRLGVEVVGVVGSTPDRARAKSLAPVIDTYEQLLADERVDVVHLTTPNHLHYPQVKHALEAGKHVVCEKPLAMTSEHSAELLELATRAGVVHCTNFNIRFYPQVQQAQALVADGRVGAVWNVHGGYLQDWLLLPTDWIWRLEHDKGGELRDVADIGSHWLDVFQFVVVIRVDSLLADLATTIPLRKRPKREIETFAAADDVEREDAEMMTEDVGHILLRLEDGTRGSLVVSQVSAGRKNSLRFEIDGSKGALAWDSERHEELWLGHRGKPNEVLLRDPALLAPEARSRTGLPAGHAEGFAETFKELYRAVYGGVAAGGPSAEPDYPTFADGHWENVLGDAVALSNRERRWVEVTK
jgi:predicted dehydrogenase